MNPIPKRILLAEDDNILRKAAGAMLRRNGYTVVLATNGEEALSAVNEGTPDLILLDLIMPKLQGFEVLKRLKTNAATASIPVIVLSNLGQDSDKDRALKEGALDFMVKANLSLDEILERIKKVF